MQPKSFYISALVAVALTCLLNLAVSALSSNTIPRQIARRMETTPGLNCLGLGNSLMEAGFDARVFQKAIRRRYPDLVALNGGMGSSFPVEHLLLLRRALQKNSGMHCVMYGFYDFQLMEPPHTNLNDLIGNRAMLYYFEPSVAAEYYQWPLGDRLIFDLTRFVPLVRERGVIWEKVEKFRRGLNSIGMPPQRTNRFGRAQDFNLLEAPDAHQFASRCEEAVASQRDLSKPVLDMIRLSRQRNSRIVMIEMPMSQSHFERYYDTPAWRRYREYLRATLARQGADYIAASDWVHDDTLFADHLHLSPRGSIVFSERLAEYSL